MSMHNSHPEPGKVSNTIQVLEKLRWNAHLGKHSHFQASKRDRKYHIWFGMPIIIINIFLGSFLLSLSGPEYFSNHNPSHKEFSPAVPDQTKIDDSDARKTAFPLSVQWLATLLAFFAASLSAMQTFFNFQKEYEGHRQIGNRYLDIARECERLIALHLDELLPLDELSTLLKGLNKKYSEVNVQAESYNVTDKDYKSALAIQENKAKNETSMVKHAFDVRENKPEI